MSQMMATIGRAAAWLAAGLFAASGACASSPAARARAEYLRREVGALSCPKTFDEAWSEARRLLADRGYRLAAPDMEAIGRSGSFLVAIFTPARTTRTDARGVRTLETGWRQGVRYRLSGSADAPGCHVTFTAIEEDRTEHGRDAAEPPRQDLEMELELVRRLSPEDAARIEAGMLR